MISDYTDLAAHWGGVGKVHERGTGRTGRGGAKRLRRGAKVAPGRTGRTGYGGMRREPRNAAALAAAGYFPRFRLSMALSKAASEKPSEYALGTTTVPPDPFTDS